MLNRSIFGRPIRSAIILMLFGLLVTGCTSGAPDEASSLPAVQETVEKVGGDPLATGDLTAVSLGVGFIPSVQFAPFYVGIEQGFFTDEGIDLALDYGFENDYLKLVGVDESQFMIGSGDQVVLGRAQGLPVRYVMNWFSRYPVVIFSKQDAGITQPADLAGTTVGIPGPFGASYVAYRGILEAGGLTEDDVKLESIGFSQAAAISQDSVDAAVDYGVNGPIVLGLEGVPTNQIELDDYMRIPSNGLVTNDATIAKDPELVERMVRATTKSIDYALEHPDEAFEISLGFVPEAGGDNEAANRAIFDASLDYWTPMDGRALGETSVTDWQDAAAFMQRIGLVDTLVNGDELFTNEFLSSIEAAE
jgi:NitT/TauT family transport system substrate-binding protein